MIDQIASSIVDIVGGIGYFGIFVLMFIESSFIPFPSEIIIVPAGYLAYRGDMNLYLIVLIGSFASLLGAWLNYILAIKFGRFFLKKILKEKKIIQLEVFFDKYGALSTFFARLLPGIRQYISLIAGLLKMNKISFSIYTLLGSSIWVSILALLGYFLGDNLDILHQYLREILIFIAFIALLFAFFVYSKKVYSKNNQ